jgi:hypothetical protein
MSYDYREYTQLYPPYVGEVSILDLLFMAGPAAMQFMLRPEQLARETRLDEAPEVTR